MSFIEDAVDDLVYVPVALQQQLYDLVVLRGNANCFYQLQLLSVRFGCVLQRLLLLSSLLRGDQLLLDLFQLVLCVLPYLYLL